MTPDLGAFFVGYKAPTRIAEMHKEYPLLFEIKSEDKYMQRKLNTDRMGLWFSQLDRELKAVVTQYYKLPIPNAPRVESGKAVHVSFKD